MPDTIAINNILYNSINKNNYFLSLNKNKSLFDLLLKDIPNINIVNDINFPFLATISSDPVQFSQIATDLYLKYHVYGLLLFHNNAPSPLKKEDKYILSKKLNNTYKIFFNKDIQETWHIQDGDSVCLMNYGAKTIYKDKTKDIILLNLSKNDGVDRLYSRLKPRYNVDILTEASDYDSCLDKIADYKIAISVEDAYSSLCCCAAGCKVLTNNVEILNKLEDLYLIDSYNIENQISVLINSTNNNIQKQQKYIEEYFNLNSFISKFDSILTYFQSKVFKHEA